MEKEYDGPTDYEILLSQVQEHERLLEDFKQNGIRENPIYGGEENKDIIDWGYEELRGEKFDSTKEEIHLKRLYKKLKDLEKEEENKIVENHNSIKAPKHIEGSENKKVIAKLDKTANADSDYGLDIDELKEDPLHQLLMKNQFYKLFYSTYRLTFNGLYEDIPLHFVVFVQNIFRSQKKLQLPDKLLKSLNCMIMSASGKAKTARAEFLINIAKELDIPMESVSQETGASLRGTVEMTASNKGNKFDFDIVPGSIRSCLLFIDEFRNALIRTRQDTQFKSYLLELAEKKEMKADTVKAKQVVVLYLKWLEACKNEEDEKEKKKLLDLDLQDETDGYRMDFATGNLMFKSNAGLFIYSQPITKQAGEDEQKLQKSFCLSQGYYNRFIFRYNPIALTPKKKIQYKAERITYIKRMKAYHNVKSDEILIKQHTKQIVKLLKQLPVTKMSADTEFVAELQAQFDNSLPEKILTLLSSENQTMLRENIDSYTDRMTYNIFPNLVYFLAYINGKVIPEAEEIEATIHFCNKSLLEYYEYLQEVLEEPIYTKYANTKIYTNLIMQDVCTFFEEKTKDKGNLDVYDKYPNSTELLTNVKTKFNSMYSSNSWSLKKYQEAMNTLALGSIIRIMKENPDTKKGFIRGAKKVIVLKPYDKNKVLTSAEEIGKIKGQYR